MKIVILTEGGRDIGFGHLARCSAIYHAFKERGVRPQFLIQGDKSIVRAINDVVYKVCNWRDNENELLKCIKNTKIAIIDSYLARLELYKRISSIIDTVLYFNDYKRFTCPKGVVLNATLNAHRLRYPARKNISYLLGASYMPLRKEFWKVGKKRIKKEIKSILITFGGGDNRAMTPRILKLCINKFPHIKKVVIIGKELKKNYEFISLKDTKTELVYFPKITALKNYMYRADVTICGGGQTLCELARIGTPAITIGVAENQRQNINAFSEASSVLMAGWWYQRNILSKVLTCMDRLKSKRARLRMSNAGRVLVDGGGARRIVDILLYRTPQLKIKESAREDIDSLRLREARDNDCRDLWLWRNHPDVRKWTFNTKKITYSHHGRWFIRKLHDKNTQIYLAEIATLGKIGQVRYDIRGNNCALINVNLNPLFLGRNLGHRLIKKATLLFLNSRPEVSCIAAQVLDGNVASGKAFQKAGYAFLREEFDKGKQVKVFTFKRKP